jgi:hypothetical protein
VHVLGICTTHTPNGILSVVLDLPSGQQTIIENFVNLCKLLIFLLSILTQIKQFKTLHNFVDPWSLILFHLFSLRCAWALLLA